MKEIILLFENVKDRLDEAKKCMKELIPCQARNAEDNAGIFIKKEYSSNEEYENIMDIKEKYDLRTKTIGNIDNVISIWKEK